MVYIPTNWKNGREGGTPITAAELNRVDEEVAAVSGAINNGRLSPDGLRITIGTEILDEDGKVKPDLLPPSTGAGVAIAYSEEEADTYPPGTPVLILTPPEPTGQFFTDFSGGLVGMTERFVDGAWAALDDAGMTGGKAIRLTGALARRGLSWDDPSDIVTDVELVTRAKVGGLQGSVAGGVLARGSGASGAETGIIAAVLTGRLQLGLINAGTYTSVTTADLPYVADGWYWIRLRVQGERITVRAWLDGTPEPAEWMIDRTSPVVTGAGWYGLYGTAATTQTWDVLGVSFSASPAPVRAL